MEFLVGLQIALRQIHLLGVVEEREDSTQSLMQRKAFLDALKPSVNTESKWLAHQVVHQVSALVDQTVFPAVFAIDIIQSRSFCNTAGWLHVTVSSLFPGKPAGVQRASAGIHLP